jgi:hypothetical protein
LAFQGASKNPINSYANQETMVSLDALREENPLHHINFGKRQAKEMSLQQRLKYQLITI